MHQPREAVLRCLLDLQQVGVQLPAQQQAVEQYRSVLLQVVLPHPPVLADALRLFRQDQFGNQIVPVLLVGDLVHVLCSFPFPAVCRIVLP